MFCFVFGLILVGDNLFIYTWKRLHVLVFNAVVSGQNRLILSCVHWPCLDARLCAVCLEMTICSAFEWKKWKHSCDTSESSRSKRRLVVGRWAVHAQPLCCVSWGWQQWHSFFSHKRTAMWRWEEKTAFQDENTGYYYFSIAHCIKCSTLKH